MEKLFGGIELGGTKIICAIGNSKGNIAKRATLVTTTPQENIPQIIDFFKKNIKYQKIEAIGIASFGPIIVDPHSDKYGYLALSAKPHWHDCNIVSEIKSALNLPVILDTDVNAAALAEYLWGKGKKLNTVVYWTIGTGIGGGVVTRGKIFHGLMHTEMGHSYIPQNTKEDPFPGICPYHKNCLEGLASGSSMKERWKVKNATDLPPDHIGWELEAEYLSYAMANTIFFLSPNIIIIGGGVMLNKELLPKIREKTLSKLKGFIPDELILKNIDKYITDPGLGQDSGICGALALSSDWKNR